MRQTVANILQEVAKDYGLTVSALKSHNRSRHITQPRQEAYYRAFVECPHVSYPEIARRIGGRDHTTILHGVRAHCERIGQRYADAIAIRQKAATPASQFAALANGYALAMKAPTMEAIR